MVNVNLIFDFDGTLFDSYDSIIDRLNKTFNCFNIFIDKKTLKEKALLTSCDNVISNVCKQYNILKDDIYKQMSLFEYNIDLIKPYPHIKDVLDNPKFNCYIFTHRDESVNKILNKYSLTNKFIEVIDGTYSFKRKPSPEGINYLIDKYQLDINKTYYIGDRLLDIECGNNANIKTIFFNSSNYHIDYSKATYVINDLIEINYLKL